LHALGTEFRLGSAVYYCFFPPYWTVNRLCRGKQNIAVNNALLEPLNYTNYIPHSARRPAASECLSSITELHLRSLTKLHADPLHSAMRQAASECLSSIRLEPEREAELRMGFDLLDRDKSGRISLSNLAVLH